VAYIAMPEDCFLHDVESPFTRGGQKVYRSANKKRLYVWDGLHGHVEGYNAQGYHIGVFDESGNLVGEAVKGRKINV